MDVQQFCKALDTWLVAAASASIAGDFHRRFILKPPTSEADSAAAQAAEDRAHTTSDVAAEAERAVVATAEHLVPALAGEHPEAAHLVARVAELARRGEWEAASGILAEVRAALAVAVVTPKEPKTPAPPAPLLLSWREITDALGRPNTPEFRNALIRLSEQHNGPLVKTGQGAQPKADREKLVAWWNGLEGRLSELDGRKRDEVETVKNQYLYGSGGEVVPDIGGSVKHRRGGST